MAKAIVPRPQVLVTSQVTPLISTWNFMQLFELDKIATPTYITHMVFG